MAHISADRVKDTTTTTGTGSLTLANSAPTGFRTLNAVAATNDTFFYAVEGGAEWEVGLGTYNGSHVFARTTVLASSNSNAAVNFSAGTKNFFITIPAGKLPASSSALLSAANISDTAYASSWDGVTTDAPSKNAVYDGLKGLIAPSPPSANWIVLDDETPQSPNTTTFVLAAINKIYYSPVFLRRPLTLSDLGIFIGATDAAKAFAVAIYANNSSTARPTGTPLAATGDISTTSGGYIGADITGSNVALSPGVYWIAIWGNTTTATYAGFTTNQYGALGVVSGNSTLSSVLANQISSDETFNSSAWPDAASETFTVISTGKIPVVFGKVA